MDYKYCDYYFEDVEEKEKSDDRRKIPTFIIV